MSKEDLNHKIRASKSKPKIFLERHCLQIKSSNSWLHKRKKSSDAHILPTGYIMYLKWSCDRETQLKWFHSNGQCSNRSSLITIHYTPSVSL